MANNRIRAWRSLKESLLTLNACIQFQVVMRKRDSFSEWIKPLLYWAIGPTTNYHLLKLVGLAQRAINFKLAARNQKMVTTEGKNLISKVETLLPLIQRLIKQILKSIDLTMVIQEHNLNSVGSQVEVVGDTVETMNLLKSLGQEVSRVMIKKLPQLVHLWRHLTTFKM